MSVEDYIELDRIFDGKEPSDNWKHALSIGVVKFFKDSIVVHYVDNDILVVNSGSIGDSKFPIGMLKYIYSLIMCHDKAIISSSAVEIASHMLYKYGFEYDEDNNIYKKGV